MLKENKLETYVNDVQTVDRGFEYFCKLDRRSIVLVIAPPSEYA